MIEVRDLWKQFGSKPVLRGVSLTIPDGEALTILGRSGGGKSVLLKHLIGLTRPDKGQVLVDGADITVMNHDQLAEVRHKFGMLFQGAALFDSMSVHDNVAYGLREHYRSMTSREVGEMLTVGFSSARLTRFFADRPSSDWSVLVSTGLS